MITYKTITKLVVEENSESHDMVFRRFNPNIDVYLDGKKTGRIKKVPTGYQYFPKGQKVGGEIFFKLEDCKRSLEKS